MKVFTDIHPQKLLSKSVELFLQFVMLQTYFSVLLKKEKKKTFQKHDTSNTMFYHEDDVFKVIWRQNVFVMKNILHVGILDFCFI